MLSLNARLDELPNKGCIIDALQARRIETLLTLANDIRLQHPSLKHKRIVLLYTNLTDFVISLLAFDGWCAALYLSAGHGNNESLDDVIEWPLTEPSSFNGNPNQSTAINLVDCPDSKQIKTVWYMATSGTTGVPKWCAHDVSSLVSAVRKNDQLSRLRWGLLYHPYRFAGLQVTLQALLSGADLIDVVEHAPIKQIDCLVRHQVNALSATPSLWRQLLMTNKLDRLPLTHITLGGEIADQALLDKLAALFPSAQIKHIYAATEVGVGFVVADQKAGFPASWLEVSADSAAQLKMSAQQTLLVNAHRPDVKSLSIDNDNSEFVDTLDRIEVIGDRAFFTGRVTGAINVGGNKVLPEKVEQLILQCEGVHQVKVYAQKSSLLGELVVADIVVNAGNEQQSVKHQVIKLCKLGLQRFEMPAKIRVVQSIVHEPSGKMNRKPVND